MDDHALEEMLFCISSSQETALDYLLDDDAPLPSEADDTLEPSTCTQPQSFNWGLSSSSELDVALEEHVTDQITRNTASRRNVSDGEIPETLCTPSLQHSKDRDWVIARIESILEHIIDGLLEKRHQLTITLCIRSGTTGRKLCPGSGITFTGSPRKSTVVRFPGGSPREAWRFTVLIRILELVHGALIDNITISKRDIYYRHADLFVNQAVVDRYVDDLACTLNVPRSLLNVAAASKGLVAGNFSIVRADGTKLSGLNDREGVLTPKLEQTDLVEMSNVRWILIIEKEATFRSLLASRFWWDVCSGGIVVTAKGYPDVASRIFLGKLTDNSPHIPIHAVVDFDPDGVAILSTYKHGSYALAHENSLCESPRLNLSKLLWLGVKSYHLHQKSLHASDMKESLGERGIMKLTLRDRHKARRMLECEICAEDGPEPEWRREIQAMLMLNIKAEIQIFEEQSGGLGFWLKGELQLGQERLVQSGQW